MRSGEGVLFPGPGPGARFGHGLAHDARTGRTILHGGFDERGVPFGDTWGWDGVFWTRLATGGPPARKWPAMAYDESRGEIVLFGGLGGAGRGSLPLGDTWRWTGSGWRLAAPTGPSPRDHARMAWSAACGRLVLFGGFDGGAVVDDTWTWNGARWDPVGEPGPPARAAHAMARGPADGTVLLFGGRSLERFHGDTWRWDGRSWSCVSETGPSPRAFHGMTAAASEDVVLLTGGWEGAPARRTHRDDTWTWRGSGWRRSDAEGPSAGGVYAMTYESVRSTVVFHGGGRKADSTRWHLRDRTWFHRDGRWTSGDAES